VTYARFFVALLIVLGTAPVSLIWCSDDDAPATPSNRPAEELDLQQIEKSYDDEIRAEIEAGSLVATARFFADCEPHAETERRKYSRSDGIVRFYTFETGSKDSVVRRDHYYDDRERLRFVSITAGAANGTRLHHRIYIAASGERLGEDQRLLQGPGYPLPRVWPDDDLAWRPREAFQAVSRCRIPYHMEDGLLRVFDHTLQPKQEIKVGTSPDDDDLSHISFSGSDDGRWRVIKHCHDVNSTEFWLFDTESGEKPTLLPDGGRHAEVHWHGNDVLEIRSRGMGYVVSAFIRVDDPERIVRVDDLLHYDREGDVYVSFFPIGVEIGQRFTTAPRERFGLEPEYDSFVNASATTESVRVEGRELVVSHRRRDGSLAHEVFYPTTLRGR